MYPWTVGIISIHFINPVSWVMGGVRCNTWTNKGYAVETNNKIPKLSYLSYQVSQHWSNNDVITVVYYCICEDQISQMDNWKSYKATRCKQMELLYYKALTCNVYWTRNITQWRIIHTALSSNNCYKPFQHTCQPCSRVLVLSIVLQLFVSFPV